MSSVTFNMGITMWHLWVRQRVWYNKLHIYSACRYAGIRGHKYSVFIIAVFETYYTYLQPNGGDINNMHAYVSV